MTSAMQINYTSSLFEIETRKKLFKNKLFWENVAKNIISKRSDQEKEIEKKFLIDLSCQDKMLLMALRDKETREFAVEMGFEICSTVWDIYNNPWEVTSVTTRSGLLKLDDIVITVRNQNKQWRHLYSRTAKLNGLREHHYFDSYYSNNKIDDVILKLNSKLLTNGNTKSKSKPLIKGNTKGNSKLLTKA